MSCHGCRLSRLYARDVSVLTVILSARTEMGQQQSACFMTELMQVNQVLELSRASEEDKKYQALQQWSKNLADMHSNIVNKLVAV